MNSVYVVTELLQTTAETDFRQRDGSKSTSGKSSEERNRHRIGRKADEISDHQSGRFSESDSVWV